MVAFAVPVPRRNDNAGRVAGDRLSVPRVAASVTRIVPLPASTSLTAHCPAAKLTVVSSLMLIGPMGTVFTGASFTAEMLRATVDATMFGIVITGEFPKSLVVTDNTPLPL